MDENSGRSCCPEIRHTVREGNMFSREKEGGSEKKLPPAAEGLLRRRPVE